MNLKRLLYQNMEKIHFDHVINHLYYTLFDKNNPLLPKNLDLKYQKPDSINDYLVLFPLLYGTRKMEIAINGTIAHALSLRGLPTNFVFCDYKMPLCIMKTSETGIMCASCEYVAKKFIRQWHLTSSWTSDFINITNLKSAKKFVESFDFQDYSEVIYKDINIGKYAESSTKRYLLKGELENFQDKDVFKAYLISAVMHVELSENIFKELKPSHLIVSNIAYLPGIFVEFFQKKGTNCIACDFGLLKGTINLNHLDNEKITLYDVSNEFWMKYSENKLSKDEFSKFDAFFNFRRQGRRAHINYGKFTNKDREQFNLLKIDFNEKYTVLFTNLLWDASLANADVVFENQLEWIHKTINWFSKNDSKNLIIKIHPAEEIVGTHQNILSYIQHNFPDIPDNIKVIEPKSSINTYLLYEIVDHGIVYTSTAGLEMAIMGIPTIVNAITHYRNKGFTFDVQKKSEYFDLLERIEKLKMTSEMRDSAYKYGYLHFYKRQIPFGFIEFGKKSYSPKKLNLMSWKELMPGRNEYLDLICDGITDNKKFFIR